ncbi:MAG: ParE toxin of type toxin-antitoxin system, parDE [Ignavibacteria bacterium]|nr:ParE toxin of type toxin-antitoxin system, parDE [Ignavibacteria bacterium]
MPILRIKWTTTAAKELDKIYSYIAIESQSKQTASDFINTIFKRTEQLELMPLSGQIENNINNFEVRYIIEGNYKIHYKYQKEMIIITDIFHTKRNPRKIKK